MKPTIIVIAHNIRSTHNVGSLFRTCEGMGVTQLILSGYTPYPTSADDSRLPHIREKITTQIHKTALGAESLVPFVVCESPDFDSLRDDGYAIVALEQSAQSTMLPEFHPPRKLALLLGEEVHGIPQDLLANCDFIVELPMYGHKESFNVSVAAGMALYGLMHAS